MKPILMLLGLLILAGAIFSVDVNSCDNITSAGTYDLIADLSGAPNDASEMPGISSACIKIAASGVTLDCHGYAIYGGGADSAGIAINGSRSDITITGCTNISGFEVGIQAVDVDDSTFYNNVVDSNSVYGFRVDYGDGNNFTSNTVSDNGLVGFGLVNNSNCHMEDNDVSDSGNGFSLSTVTDCTFTENSVSTDNNGFFMGINSSGNYFYDNLVMGGGNSGFVIVTGSTDNIFEDNGVLWNTNWGFTASSQSGNNTYIHNYVYDNGMEGFLMSGSSGNNLFMNNNVTANDDDGMAFMSGSGGNNFTGNTVIGNGGNGFSFDSSGQNEFTSNNASLNAGNGFSFTGSSGYIMTNDTASGNYANGMLFTSSLGGIMSNATVTSNALDGIAFVSSPGGIPYYNVISDNGGHGLSMVSSGGKIPEYNTISGNGGDGIFSVGSGGSIIDFNVIFSNGGNGLNVSDDAGGLYGPNNMIYDNTLSGIRISNVNSTAFYFNNVSNNSLAGILVTDGSMGNSIFSNRIDGNADGLVLDSAGGNTLDNNTIFSNTGAGLSLTDTNGTVVSDTHLFSNTPDFIVSGTGISFSFAGVVFDSPLGNYSNFTNLSITDTVDSDYSISHDVQPGPFFLGLESFEGKFVSITNLSGMLSIDSVIWHWTDAESSGHAEGRFGLAHYNGSYKFLNKTPDTGANTLSLTDLAIPSVFGILESPENDDGGEGGGADKMTVDFETSCEGNVITVDDAGAPLEDVEVLVWDADTLADVASGETDSSGEFSFTGCGMDVKITLMRSGYSKESMVRTLVDCGDCVVAGCAVDTDCLSNESCVSGTCVAVSCECGQIIDNQCSPYECCEDEDCGEGQCVDNACQEAEKAECSSDSDCLDTEFCDIPSNQTGGECEPVSGTCGYAADHSWVSYECGTGCPECASGYTCKDNRCEPEMGISGPASASVGGNVTIAATEGGAACADCEMKVTLPDGSSITSRTDAQGKLIMPLKMEGDYLFSLLDEGQAVKTITVESLATKAVEEEQAPQESDGLGAWLLWVLLLIVVIAAVVIYLRRRR